MHECDPTRDSDKVECASGYGWSASGDGLRCIDLCGWWYNSGDAGGDGGAENVQICIVVVRWQ